MYFYVVSLYTFAKVKHLPIKEQTLLKLTETKHLVFHLERVFQHFRSDHFFWLERLPC